MEETEISEKLNTALTLFNSGQWRLAESAFGEILSQLPNHAAATHFLGLCKMQLGNVGEAKLLLSRSVELMPACAAFFNNTGLAMSTLGDLESAASYITKAAELDRASASICNNLGTILQRLGRHQEALNQFRLALERDPKFVPALNNLATAFTILGRANEAIRLMDAVQAHNNPEVELNRGKIYLTIGRVDDAVAAFQKAIQLRPAYVEAINALASALNRKGESGLAADQLARSLEVQPDNPQTLLEIGHILRENGEATAARICFRRAVEIDPENWIARWNACLTLPVIYKNSKEVGQFRTLWQNGIEELQNAIKHPDTASRCSWIAPHTNFCLHYQASNDLREQQQFAGIISFLAKREFSDLELPRRASRGTAKKRIGFISFFFSLHTVFKLFHGWIRNLNRAHFHVVCIYLGRETDKATEFVRKHCDEFISMDGSQKTLVERILTLELDVLIYLEIGMEPVTQSLAALRMAPVQCMAWGHPVTSGLPTIDYFLSSELMERPDADRHYSEKLVRLPNLSIWYPSPDISVAEAPSAAKGRDKKRIVFACLQSLFKLLPQHDDVYPRIAILCPTSEFWFIGLDNENVTNLFRQRIEQAFCSSGLDPAAYLRIFPKMTFGYFLGMVREADVILDSIGWSGGNTTLEAVRFGKPVVTLPGELMRSRHTAAVLRRMSLEDGIARDMNEYVEIAARFGNDCSLRQSVSTLVAERSSCLYWDRAAVAGLEAFLLELPSL